MAVRTSFTAGEVLAAADLTDTFGAKLNLAGGKILQIVRATDTTNRSTTSTSFVDASISVTITPQRNTSAVLLIWSARFEATRSDGVGSSWGNLRITDNSANAISGAQSAFLGQINAPSGSTNNNYQHSLLIGYATPATTSAVTYKGQFLLGVAGGTVSLINAFSAGQLYAIEVSA